MSMTNCPVRVTVIGIGYLGLTHAVCMADLGHDVLAIDVDDEKIAQAAAARRRSSSPASSRCCARTSTRAGCGSPARSPRSASSARSTSCAWARPRRRTARPTCATCTRPPTRWPRTCPACLIVGKSTVPVGTARRTAGPDPAAAPAGDRGRPGLEPRVPARGVRGPGQPDPGPVRLRRDLGAAPPTRLREVYAKPLAAGIPALMMDLETAELVKVAANAFLATKISFINAMAEVCEAVGADVIRLADALGHDERIGGQVPRAGPRLRRRLPAQGHPRLPRHRRRAGRELGGQPARHGGRDQHRPPRAGGRAWPARPSAGPWPGSGSAVLGIAFKPNSDDIRDSPSLDICDRLSPKAPS